MNLERQRKKSASLPPSSRSLSLLKADDMNTLRISKSTECLSPELQPETACMMLPESLSLEDIFTNNNRLSSPQDSKKANDLKSRLRRHLKGLCKDNL